MWRILLISDLHVGSRWGLWPPKFSTIDTLTGDTVSFLWNDTQKWLWRHWLKMLKVVRNVDCIVINGDVIDGLQKRERGRGLVTPNITWQTEAAEAVIDTLPKVPMYLTAGTEYHELEDGRPVEYALAQECGGEYGDELVIEECGLRLFCRHTISSSQSTWQYESTAPGREHMLLFLNRAAEKYGDIDAAVFSHRHKFNHVEFPSGHAVITPGWQAKTMYAVKKGIISPPDIGWITLEIRDRKCIAVDKQGLTTKPNPCRVVGRKNVTKN